MYVNTVQKVQQSRSTIYNKMRDGETEKKRDRERLTMSGIAN